MVSASHSQLAFTRRSSQLPHSEHAMSCIPLHRPSTVLSYPSPNTLVQHPETKSTSNAQHQSSSPRIPSPRSRIKTIVRQKDKRKRQGWIRSRVRNRRSPLRVLARAEEWVRVQRSTWFNPCSGEWLIIYRLWGNTQYIVVSTETLPETKM